MQLVGQFSLPPILSTDISFYNTAAAGEGEMVKKIDEGEVEVKEKEREEKERLKEKKWWKRFDEGEVEVTQIG